MAPESSTFGDILLGPNDEYVQTAFDDARWPSGPRCLRCRSADIFRFPNRSLKGRSLTLFKCRPCGYQFTVTTRDPLRKTHVPMKKWLEAIAMIKRDSARTLKPADLMTHFGITRKTAQLMCRRLRQGMEAPFVRNLYVALRSYKKPEVIYRNLFPDLYTD